MIENNLFHFSLLKLKNVYILLNVILNAQYLLDRRGKISTGRDGSEICEKHIFESSRTGALFSKGLKLICPNKISWLLVPRQ